MVATIAGAMGALRGVADLVRVETVRVEAERILLDAARRNHPKKTGATAEQLRVQSTVRGLALRLELRGGMVSRYLITGTRAHDIEPVRARVLRWEDSGGVHFARRVHHPGTRPNLFQRSRVVYTARPEIMALGLRWSRRVVQDLKTEIGG